MKVLEKKDYDVALDEEEVSKIEACSKVLTDILITMENYDCSAIAASEAINDITKKELDECVDILEYLCKLCVDIMY